MLENRSIAFSILLPIFNEEANLRPVINEIVAAMSSLNQPFEIIAVDDASTDQSPQILKQLCVEVPQLKLILFRKNMGQTAAFDAGFRNAQGNIIITLDSDGQNDPNDIPAMITLLNQGYDFVGGRRKNRKDGFILRRLPSIIANFLIRALTKTQFKDLGCSLKVYRKEITNELRLYGEMHRFIAILVEMTGAKTIEMDVNHRPRLAGKSKYGLSRTFKVVIDLLSVWFSRGFQTKPLYVFGGMGFSFILAGTLLASYVLYEKIFLEIWVHKNPLFLIAIFISTIGLQFLGLGLIAEMIMKTYYESQNKNTFLIKEKINFN